MSKNESFFDRHTWVIGLLLGVGISIPMLLYGIYVYFPENKAIVAEYDAKAKPYCDKIEFYSQHTTQCERIGVRP